MDRARERANSDGIWGSNRVTKFINQFYTNKVVYLYRPVSEKRRLHDDLWRST